LLNPVVYSLRNKDIKRAFLKVMGLGRMDWWTSILGSWSIHHWRKGQCLCWVYLTCAFEPL
jgi:hypothetical protein